MDGTTQARNFSLSADQGSITVSGAVHASGATGGTISLVAWNDLTLLNGSVLNVAAQDFNSAGKGGAISLESGSSVFNGVSYAPGPSGVLDIQAGSSLILSVAANTAPAVTAANIALGRFNGTVHVRAPQNVAGTNLLMNPINGTILDASSIQVEGYRVFTPAGGTITTAVQATIRTGLNTFNANIAGITTALLASNPGLAPFTQVVPGVEVINRTGDITLGGSGLTAASDWNLGSSTWRFGPDSAPGVLTLRAGGDLVFFNALHDGFNITNALSAYNAQLLAFNPLLPDNAQSWSYRLAAGADFTAADFRRVQPISALDTAFPTRGSLLLGKNGGLNTASSSGLNATTSSAINAGTGRFQVIRTGTGDIDIAVGRDLKLLNQFASIYTVGALITDPTMGGTFAVPTPNLTGASHGNLGTDQQIPDYPAQYTLAGGNVTIAAGGDMLRQTRDLSGNLVADSSRELPMNWLYRRGYVDPATGLFGASRFGEIASTTWWVDFSNFFEGVGALGGGNVTLVAGRDIANVDALIPTNARMPGQLSGGGAIAPSASSLVEIGGGDLVIRAGRNIDGGVYYVERGQGALNAAGSILTNSTRSPSRGILAGFGSPDIQAPETWLPTTLFVGKGGFDVAARGDILLGPVANPFVLPQGFNNTYWYKSWFTTLASTSYANVTSLGGAVSLRQSVTMPVTGSPSLAVPVLQAFMQRQHLLVTSGVNQSASNAQPWLRLAEDLVTPFSTMMTVNAPSLTATAFSGDINLAGTINLFPSPTGTAELLAAGSINGLQTTGRTTIGGSPFKVWTSGRLNLSDANPSSMAGIASPYAYQSLVGISLLARSSSSSSLGSTFLRQFDRLFAETGSTTGSAAVIQTKQALHAPGPLHAGDPEPLRLYAMSGDISGFTLFSPKPSQIIADRDLADVALYLQNVAEDSVSVVSAGRDVIPYNANSPLRVATRAAGNAVNIGDGPRAGDIQIGGPGILEVLAGRNLDLGSGANNADGTGVGISSIGNGRNPFLGFDGASIIAGAGLGAAGGLSSGTLEFETFINTVLGGENGARYFSEYSGANSGGGMTVSSVEDLEALPLEQRNAIALDLFYLALRDAGRDFATTGDYDAGFAAIDALFPAHERGRHPHPLARHPHQERRRHQSLRRRAAVSLSRPAYERHPRRLPASSPRAAASINIFTNDSVNLGISRIFTLRGGDIIIWSSAGDIAAGASVQDRAVRAAHARPDRSPERRRGDRPGRPRHRGRHRRAGDGRRMFRRATSI